MSKEKKQSNTKKITRSQRRAQQKHQKQMQNLGLMTIGVVTIIVALIIAANTQVSTTSEIVPALPRDHPMADGNAMGDPNAPVVMVNFSDYQCSYCRNFFLYTEPYIIENYIATGKVYFIFRPFVIYSGGDSGRAAQASYCAGDQGKFWEMHDIIYSNFSASNSGGYSTDRLITMAELINLDVEKFKDCLKGDVYANRIEEDRTVAIEKGASGTPTFFINDQIIVGNEAIAKFIQTIDSELAKAGE
jgi:protein-disulfide isomerase